ncbi:DUF2423 domain-containing protein [Aspergillus affinis]|uniref:DUF2423 domain-containing protein n=1 Tax=Aspergillus affinis TaxID=1070780 RepID=UPI0022FE6EB6|nr:uncharacterized protein KD926_007554 [Aspergillus affinis]KAI9040881.1 hypothetical protein KD926_007554 [Aspergillus affinis]
MAKSVRASVMKRNKAKLRANVFGPVVDARTERLSAKLQELASQPKPTNQENPNEENKGTLLNPLMPAIIGLQKTEDNNDAAAEVKPSEDMDIDTVSTKKSQKSGRIHKRHSNRKNRSSIVFRPHQSKSKKGPKRK